MEDIANEQSPASDLETIWLKLMIIFVIVIETKMTSIQVFSNLFT